MPKGGNPESAKGKVAFQRTAKRRLDVGDSPTNRPSTAVVPPPQDPEEIDQHEPTFENLLSHFHGVNLTPSKLDLLMNAPTEKELAKAKKGRELRKRIQEESSTESEKEREDEPSTSTRPRREVTKKRTRPVDSDSGEEELERRDIEVSDSGSEYAPSEIADECDFSGFEHASEPEMDPDSPLMSDSDSASSVASDTVTPRRRTSRVSGRRERQLRVGRRRAGRAQRRGTPTPGIRRRRR